jgi:RsiW-degrading membrane proteinase PrsW (M82 family)
MLLYALILTFIGISTALAWFLISHDRGAKEPVSGLWTAVGFGALGAVMAAYAEGWLINSDNLISGMPQGTIMTTALLVGLIEEACKFLPLALYIYKRPYFNEYTDGVIYFALAGLAFGLPENILYTLQYGKEAGIARLLLTPLFHAAVTGVVGFFLIKAKLEGKPAFYVVPAFLIAALLHGLYDFGLSSGSKVYAVGEDRGKSAMGHNSFCRSCGQPNPQHYLYCVHCGMSA